MAHDVFISYSSQDKVVADAVTATLEQRRIRCWIAPRDVLPGVPYGESIIDALENSRAMVLVFSSHANTSPQVMREVERAVSKGVPIIPFRIENVTPSKSMEYFISVPHWLDAWTPPLGEHINRLADSIQRLLGIEVTPAPAPTSVPVTPTPAPTSIPVATMPTPVPAVLPPKEKPAPRRPWLIIAVAAVGIVIVALLLFRLGVGLTVRRIRIERATQAAMVAEPPAMAVPQQVVPPEGSASCPGATLIIRRGARGAVADAYIWEQDPDANGNYDTLYTGIYERGRKQTLIRFEIEEIPRNTQVLSAMLYIHCEGGEEARMVRVHRITRPWEEGRVAWGNFVGSFEPKEVWGSFSALGIGWKSADVTGLVQSWVNGVHPNFGLLLDDFDAKTADTFETYRSSEAGEVELRPRLEMCLVPPRS